MRSVVVKITFVSRSEDRPHQISWDGPGVGSPPLRRYPPDENVGPVPHKNVWPHREPYVVWKLWIQSCCLRLGYLRISSLHMAVGMVLRKPLKQPLSRLLSNAITLQTVSSSTCSTCNLQV